MLRGRRPHFALSELGSPRAFSRSTITNGAKMKSLAAKCKAHPSPLACADDEVGFGLKWKPAQLQQANWWQKSKDHC
jgi:hypothetical protein